MSTEEEVILEFVLDKFSNIKEVLNATKDIENFLIELKLHKNQGEIGVIFEKVKNLVDSLYDHSVNVKNEFYERFNNLKVEKTNVGKDSSITKCGSEVDKVNENTAIEGNNTSESNNEEVLLDTESAKNSGNSVNCNDCDPGVSESSNITATQNEDVDDSSDATVDDLVNTTSNDELAQNEDVDNPNDTTIEAIASTSDPAVIQNEDDDTSNSNTTIVGDIANIISSIVTENEDDNISNTATENVDNTTVQDSCDSVLKSPIIDVAAESCEKDKENNSDNTPEKLNTLEKDASSVDPLENRGESPDIIDSSIADDAHVETDKDNEEENDLDDQEEENESEKANEIQEIKKEPRIRLVDLSKLIDPKPKKSVKFDSSIIILTSSDEESNTPKKRSGIKEQNGKLKPALKPSPHRATYINTEALPKEKKFAKLLGSKKSARHKPESEENDSDVSKTDKDKKNKIKGVEKSDKNKHRKKDQKGSSESEVSDEEPSTKKKKTSKQEITTKEVSDSDCVIDENSDSDNQESPNSRRSTRLNDNQKKKQKEKERLKTLFKRKPSKHGASRFEIVNKNSANDSNSETDVDDDHKKKSMSKKKDLVEEHLSDTSSLSNDENEDVKGNGKSKDKSKKNKRRKRKSDLPLEDKKFTYEVYIPLPQIQCERMKEIYLKNKDILEVKRLRNVNLSRSSKRSRKNKSDSKSSSDTEKPKKKKSKSEVSDKEPAQDAQTSDDELLTDLVEKVVDENGKKDNKTPQESKENDDERMADIVMSDMLSSNTEEKKSEESNDDSEEEKKKKSDEKDSSRKKHKAKPESERDTDKTDKNLESEEKMETSDAEKKSDESSNEAEEENKAKSSSSEDKNEKGAPKKTNDNKEKDKSDDTNKSKDDSDTTDKEDKDDASDKDKDKKSDNHDSSSDSEGKKEKKKWRSDKLLTSKIDSSDSEEEFSKYNAKKEKSRKELMSDDEIKELTMIKRKTKKRSKKIVICDSDESDDKNKSDSSDKSSKSSEKSSSSSEKEDEEEQKKRSRKRIKRTRDSSSSSDDDKSTRKNIRKVIGKDALSETTKQAEAEEKERKARIAEKQKKYNQIYENLTESKVEKLVLDYNEKEKKELLSVHKGIVKKLKPHQASGIQFMWDACFESLQRTKSTKGSGCILAHCMGLGKTLQVIALGHTLLMNNEKTGVEKILVVCPVNTVLNWKAEFKKWMPKSSEIEVYELVSCKQNYERQYVVQEWHNDGGVLIIGYAMFRNLSNPDNKRISKKMRTAFQEGLVDPGPDLVVCDEGHLLKNEKTNLSIAMNRIKTLRRIVLTGTPLQNNLKEYWCMVQFIKPNLLGTYKEYLNRFVNPITNGQYTDSTQHDIILMRKRSHVLHKLLDGIVQRRDYSVLEPYLPPKYEYVLFVSLSETQVKLYKHYIDRFARQNDGSNRTSFLFTDFQQFQRICTHPRVLLDKSKEKKEKEFEESDSEGSLRDFIDDGEESASSTGSSSSKSNSGSEGSDNDTNKKKKGQQKTRVTRAQAALRKENNEGSDSDIEEVTPKEWWQEYCDGEELDNINNSGKLFLLFQILKECEEIGDKVLVFSQSLYTLNCIEYFLQAIDEATQDGKSEKVGGHSGSWSLGLDYFRLDGSSSCDNRATWCDSFNNPSNTRARLFLISTKAGGLGINLVAANRVIIFDVSWNPSHDIQSIYRVYRFGQTKPCYIYRFVSYGTMEMKIYERQVTKQAISKRVIDEQQIDRHYNQNDLQELYQCDLNPTDRPIPLVPKDVLLGEMLQKYEKTIFRYHLHQSLLENKTDEGLNEEERKAAWEEFENEKVLRKNTGTGIFNNFNMNPHAIAAALASIVRKDNPAWSEVQIKGIIPALAQQLQVQLAEGDVTMYLRVQKEMQLMQALQAQKMKEAFYQQQVMRMIQQQQQQAKTMGNMHIDPVQLARAQANIFNNLVGGPSSAPQRQMPNDVIELND